MMRGWRRAGGMWRLALLGLAALAVCACAPKARESAVSRAELSREQEELVGRLGFRRDEDVFFWDFAAPAGAQSVRLWMEYYKDGERVEFGAAQDDGARAGEKMELSRAEGSATNAGKITLTLRSRANPVHGTNLGTTDFFDGVSQTAWSLNVTDGRNSMGCGFTTGYDLLERYPGGERYGVRYGSVLGTLPAALEQDLTLVCFQLTDGVSGNDLDMAEAQADPDFYRDARYAYALKCRFEERSEE